MKRVFAGFLCLVVVVSACRPVRAHAIAPALAAAPEVASVLANLAVTCGVTVWVADMFDPVVDRIWENLTPEQRQTLTNAANSGSWVMDAATGAYKYVMNIGDDIWQGVKTVVDSLFDAGENVLTEDGGLSYPNVSEISTVFDVKTGLNSLPVSFRYYRDSSRPDVYVEYYRYPAGGFYENLYFNPPTPNVWGITSSPIERVTYYYNFTDDVGVFQFWYGLSLKETRQYSKCNSVQVHGASVVVGSVYGDAGVLDNPDWSWVNKKTGKKEIPIIPPLNDLPGLPSLPGTGVSDVIDYDSVKNGLVGKTAQDLALENVGGLTIAQDGTIVNEGVTDTVVTPEAGIEGQTSLKYLFFSKFPFCLPWDLKNAFALLVAPAEAPAWEIDLVPAGVKNRMGITSDTKWVIDMEEFEIVGQVSRWTSTISFCLALIVLTRRIIRS